MQKMKETRFEAEIFLDAASGGVCVHVCVHHRLCNRFNLSAAPGQQGTALRIASPAREAKKVRWAMPIAVFRAAALTFPSPRQT